MAATAAIPTATPLVTLNAALFEKPKQLKDARDNLSAIVAHGPHLFAGGDEGTQIDRFTRQSDGSFADHTRFDLATVLDLPAGGGPKAPEIDIEGLDYDDGYLWIIGSHSRKRPKIDSGKTDAENLARLADVRADGNRFTLARVPVRDSDGVPVAEAGTRRAARLEGGVQGNLLLDALRADPVLGPFCDIPSKDNGLDIEGLAVRGYRVFAGLRGPVLRGWAVVLDLELAVAPSAPARLVLARAPRKHVVNLDGLGVRELVVDGKDLLILAGPTMDLDGPVALYRLADALGKTAPDDTVNATLAKLLDIPFAQDADHAEGLALLSPHEVMVCYDSPGPARTPAANQILLDVFRY